MYKKVQIPKDKLKKESFQGLKMLLAKNMYLAARTGHCMSLVKKVTLFHLPQRGCLFGQTDFTYVKKSEVVLCSHIIDRSLS